MKKEYIFKTPKYFEEDIVWFTDAKKFKLSGEIKSIVTYWMSDKTCKHIYSILGTTRKNTAHIPEDNIHYKMD
jgi:hypothetical protein